MELLTSLGALCISGQRWRPTAEDTCPDARFHTNGGLLDEHWTADWSAKVEAVERYTSDRLRNSFDPGPCTREQCIVRRQSESPKYALWVCKHVAYQFDIVHASGSRSVLRPVPSLTSRNFSSVFAIAKLVRKPFRSARFLTLLW